MTGISTLGGLAATSLILAFISLSSLAGTVAFIIVVIANRADPDPTGKRPMAAYFFGGAFVTLFIAVLGALIAVFSLIGLIGTNNNGGFYGSELHPATDAAIRGITVGLLLVVVAGAAHVIHARRGFQLASSESELASPTRRVERGYLAVVSFISVLVVVISVFLAIYELLGLIAPGVYHAGSSTSQAKALLDVVAVSVVFAGVFYSHQKLVGGSLRLFEPRGEKSADHEEITGGGPNSA